MGVIEETVPEQRAVTFRTVVTGVVIGAIEVVFAVAFASLVFAGYFEFYFLDDGVGLYLAAAAVTLAFMGWRTLQVFGGRIFCSLYQPNFAFARVDRDIL